MVINNNSLINRSYLVASLGAHIQSNLHAANQNAAGGATLEKVAKEFNCEDIVMSFLISSPTREATERTNSND